MNIIDIEGKHIKIGQTSITVKNPNTGKTCGVVRNTCRFKDLPNRQQNDFYPIVCKAELWGKPWDILYNVIVVDGKISYLYNIKKDEVFEKYYKGKEDSFPAETKRYLEYKATADKAAEYMQVIKCYFD